METTYSKATSIFGAMTITQTTAVVTILDEDGSIVPESALAPALDTDGIAVAEIRVERFRFEGGDLTAELAGGIQSFESTLTYDAGLVEILDVREVPEFAGNTTFDAISVPGQLTITGSTAGSPVTATPSVLAKIVLRLIGSSADSTQFTLTNLQITEGGTGTAYNQEFQVSDTYRRGDVMVDGQVTAADRLFLAECVVELRGIG